MQLTKLENLSKENILFHKAKGYSVNNSKLKYKRIKIETSYSNGKKGPLVIETPLLFSFGVTERKNQDTDQLTGYSIPVCLWKKDENPFEKEQAFLEGLTNIYNICLQYLEDEYGPDLASNLTNILYYKQIEFKDKKGKTKKKKDKSAAPVLYVKLIYSDKTKKILSLFRTKGSKDVNAFDYLNQYFNTKMAMIIESIYMSKNIVSLQIKGHEVFIKPLKPRESILTIQESDDEEDEDNNEKINISDIEDIEY